MACVYVRVDILNPPPLIPIVIIVNLNLLKGKTKKKVWWCRQSFVLNGIDQQNVLYLNCFFFLSGWGEEEVSWEGKFFGCWFFFLFLLTHFVPVCAWASVCACVRVQLFEQLVSLASLANVNIDSENSIKDWETLLSLPPMHYIIYKCIYIYMRKTKPFHPGLTRISHVWRARRERETGTQICPLISWFTPVTWETFACVSSPKFFWPNYYYFFI